MNQTNVITAELTISGTWLSSKITGVMRESIWNELIGKIYNPEKYLQVKDVITYENEDGNSIHRSMYFFGNANGEGMQPQTIEEDIYLNEEEGTVRYVVLDDLGNQTSVEYFNIIIIEEENIFRLEFYNLNVKTNIKTPLKETIAFQIIIDLAKSNEADQEAEILSDGSTPRSSS